MENSPVPQPITRGAVINSIMRPVLEGLSTSAAAG